MRKFTRPDTKAAGKSFQQAVDSIVSLVKNDAHQWKAALMEKLADVPGNHKAIGKNFLEKGLTTDAIHRFKIVRWMRPNDAEVVALLAESYAKSGDALKAKSAMIELRKKHPSYRDTANVEKRVHDILNPPKIPPAPPANMSDEAMRADADVTNNPEPMA